MFHHCILVIKFYCHVSDGEKLFLFHQLRNAGAILDFKNLFDVYDSLHESRATKYEIKKIEDKLVKDNFEFIIRAKEY